MVATNFKNIVRILIFVFVMAFIAHESYAKRIVRSIKVDGITRKYIAHIPPKANGLLPMSVIFAFHPLLGSAEGFEEQTGFDLAPNADKFIIVYPDGYRHSWNADECCGAALRKNIDDIEFVRSIFDDLETFANVSRRNNFAVGFSNGAMFSQKLICNMSDRFTGMVVSAGLYNTEYGCDLTQPVSAIFMSGTKDPFSPFSGGTSKASDTIRPGVPSVAKSWAKANQCQAQKPAYNTTPISGAGCTLHDSCRGRVQVYACAVPNMGHWWPGQSSKSRLAERVFGPSRPDLSIAPDVLDFFITHGAQTRR